MKRVAAVIATAFVALGMNGAHGAQASALASDVTLRIVNTDPSDTSAPSYFEVVLLTDVDAMVDGQPEFNAPEVVGFMASLHDTSPPSPDASSAALVSGGNTMSTTASSTGRGSAEADAGSGGGGELLLGAGETATLSMTLQLSSAAPTGGRADAAAQVCFVLTCDSYEANGTTRTVAYSRSFSNTSDDFEGLLLSLAMSSIVTSVPEPPSDRLLLAGLGALGLMASGLRRARRR